MMTYVIGSWFDIFGKLGLGMVETIAFEYCVETWSTGS